MLQNFILSKFYVFRIVCRLINQPFKRQSHKKVKHTQTQNLPTNCLSVFNHFVILALKGLKKTFGFSVRIDRTTLFASIRILINSLPPKCTCNMGMRIIKKFLFKVIYSGNVFLSFRKVLPSLSYSEIEIIKALGVKFLKNHGET